jgi:protein-disulfide isomerase
MNSLPLSLTHPARRRALIVALSAVVAVSGIAVAQEKAKPAPAASAVQKYKTNVKGPADAPIKVVEFADFMCGGCQAAAGALRSYFERQGDDINITFKNFPLEKTCNPGIGQTVHNGACELALGAICAAELERFWPYHDRIFERAWQVATRQDVIENGVAVGMDKKKLEACMASPAANSKLALQIKEAFEVKVDVTPTFVINGKKLAGTKGFMNAVEEERKKLAAPAPASAPKK